MLISSFEIFVKNTAC